MTVAHHRPGRSGLTTLRCEDDLATGRTITPDLLVFSHRGVAVRGGIVVEGRGVPYGRSVSARPQVTDRADWREHLRGAETDPEVFFLDHATPREATRICTGCEVRTECLQYALLNDERFGVWGGLTGIVNLSRVCRLVADEELVR